METAIKELKNLADYDNVLVVDRNGVILFYDLADVKILKTLGMRPEEFIGSRITSFYTNLTEENSTLLSAIRTGESLCNVRQEMKTRTGNEYISMNSTFPIKQGEEIVGAIEFSKHFFKKPDIRVIDQYAGHKIYRKNNTIYTINDIITENPGMLEIKRKIERIARSDSTVFLYGSTGTGKEMVAQAIHNAGSRYGKQFLSLNCGAIPPNLIESTLFGTVKGSFTGSEDMPGAFEQANGGTLFLDEINSLDLHLQVKLLKAIEEKTIRRIGGKKNIFLDIRVISATNEHPEQLLAEKRLREDLYYRLGVVQLELPLLKDRPEDIKLLLDTYIAFYNAHMDVAVDGYNDEVLDCFMGYDWPGNVRELKNAVETAFNQVESRMITLEDIPYRVRQFKKGPQASAVPIRGKRPLKDAVEEFELTLIQEALKESNGVIAESARILGLSKQLLKYKMEKHGLR
ncbi:sigma-54 interaction domain-containing protein [Bacillus sp. B-jedd]|uniref:sigma-54 interaction domain-containing protein n=1 Tax=Bacillus sp. B-jedd TaxID=1476857 RepID=UPI000515695B|nr:sigma 54-interacting transcriptional regulator [Bacillus sp. B-jedd]CEG26391.1 transcriptional activator of arginine utilization operons [Bacillus sp. B-jedd]